VRSVGKATRTLEGGGELEAPIDTTPWGLHAVTADYHAVPQVFCCDPPAGAVWLTADQAERAGHRIRVIDVDPGQAVIGASLYADGYPDTFCGPTVGDLRPGPVGGPDLRDHRRGALWLVYDRGGRADLKSAAIALRQVLNDGKPG